MYSPLLIVDVVLNHQQNAAALQDLGPTIADYLGPDRYLSLHQACHFGSLKLLDWMWRVSRSCNNFRTPSGSLISYLHSNCHYYQWQFSESLEIAAGRGDVKIVQWIFEHFKNCEVAVEVVEIAAKNGHLEVLQFILDHDQERKNDVTTGDRCLSGKVAESSVAGHKVHWGGSSLVYAVENGHFDVVQWLCRCNTHGCSEAQTTLAIKTALLLGDMKIAEFLLPRGKCILDYAEFCSYPDVIEWKLDCGYFQHDVFGAGVAIKDLVMSGRLDLMQRLAEQHDPPPENSGWSTNWRCAMVHACMYGNRDILQWLMEHPAGRWTLDGDGRLFSELIFSTAYNGSIEVMEYLYEHGVIDKVRDALMHAIRENHLDMVKWLMEHFPKSERIPDYCVMDEAARYGRLEMLDYFQGQDMSAVSGFFPSVMSSTQKRTKNSSGEKFMTQMFVPSADDYLKVRPTLCRYRSEWDPTDPMDDAAANGHLEVVKWLHFNRSEGCTTAAMDCAAANGHLDVVKWLHTHRSEGCTSKAMDGAAENGHLDVIQWIYSNRFEGCTLKAIKGALNYGHLRIAVWLHTHLPSLTPANVVLWRNVPDLFDLLLFRRFYFRHSFTSSIMKYAKKFLMYKSNKIHIFAWLQEEFPTVPDIREEERR